MSSKDKDEKAAIEETLDIFGDKGTGQWLGIFIRGYKGSYRACDIGLKGIRGNFNEFVTYAFDLCNNKLEKISKDYDKEHIELAADDIGSSMAVFFHAIKKGICNEAIFRSMKDSNKIDILDACIRIRLSLNKVAGKHISTEKIKERIEHVIRENKLKNKEQIEFLINIAEIFNK